MLRLNVESQLQTEWEPILKRQLHLLLSPVLTNINFGTVNLYMQYDHSTNLNYFCCEFQGYGANNAVFYAFTQNTDGKIAIRDALSRIRRTIIRKTQRIISNTNVASISSEQSRPRIFRDF